MKNPTPGVETSGAAPSPEVTAGLDLSAAATRLDELADGHAECIHREGPFGAEPQREVDTVRTIAKILHGDVSAGTGFLSWLWSYEAPAALDRKGGEEADAEPNL